MSSITEHLTRLERSILSQLDRMERKIDRLLEFQSRLEEKLMIDTPWNREKGR